MIQSFSIVFAGYKMPACLRPAMSSSSAWCLCRGLGLRSVPITGTIRHYNTLSHLLSTLYWPDIRYGGASCVAGSGLFLASHDQRITGESNTCCQPGRDGYKQETSVKLISSILSCLTHPWWGGAWESLYPSSVRAGMKPWQWGIFLSNPFKVTIHLIWS